MKHQLKHWELVGLLNLSHRLEVYFLQQNAIEESDIFFHLYNN